MTYDPVSQKLLIVYNQAAKVPDAASGRIAAPVALLQDAGPTNGGKTLKPAQKVVRTSTTDTKGDAIARWTTADGLLVHGGQPHAATCTSHGDHRIAMAIAVAVNALDGESHVHEWGSVAVSNRLGAPSRKLAKLCPVALRLARSAVWKFSKLKRPLVPAASKANVRRRRKSPPSLISWRPFSQLKCEFT